MQTISERKITDKVDHLFGDKEPEIKQLVAIEMQYDDPEEKEHAIEKAIKQIKRSNESYVKELNKIGRFLTHDASGNLVPFEIGNAFSG